MELAQETGVTYPLSPTRSGDARAARPPFPSPAWAAGRSRFVDADGKVVHQELGGVDSVERSSATSSTSTSG